MGKEDNVKKQDKLSLYGQKMVSLFSFSPDNKVIQKALGLKPNQDSNNNESSGFSR